ncbi:MAG TPA: NAD-dependent epimerase/dehydratase family protein, partial [Bacteroidia bacterium]|nr:NAD-dependent epimerase/dehydratase family protein [Bacteroidia bacterium]
MKILITGASGLIGHHLTDYFLLKGHQVAHLGRSVGIPSEKKTDDASVQHFLWNPEKESIDIKAIQWADAIVHLAGASVSDEKWSEKRKKEIIDSRVKSAELLFKTIQKEKNNVR